MLKINCNILLIVILLECLAFEVYSQEVQAVVRNGRRNSSDSTNNTPSGMTEDVWLNSLLKDINTPLENVPTHSNDIQGSSVFSLSDVVELNSTNNIKKVPNSKDISSTNGMPSKISSGNDQNQGHIFDVLDKKQNPKVVHTITGNRKTTAEKPTDFLFFQDSPNENVINIGMPSKISPSNDQNQDNVMNVLEKRQHSKNNVHKNTENRLITTLGKPTDLLLFQDAPKDKTIQNKLQTSNKDNVISHELNARNSLKTISHDKVLLENHGSKVNSNDLYLQLENIIKRLLNSNSNLSSSLRSSGKSLFGGQSRDSYPWDITANNYLKVNSHSNIPHPEPETEPHPEPFFPSNANINARSQSRGINSHTAVNSFQNLNSQSNIPHPEPETEPRPEPFFPLNADINARSQSRGIDSHTAVNSFLNLNSQSNIPHPEPETEPRPEPNFPSNVDINARSQSRGIDSHNAVNSFINLNSQSNIPHPEPETEPRSEPFFPSNADINARSQSGGIDGHNAVNSFLNMNSHSNIPHPEPEVEPHSEPFFPSNAGGVARTKSGRIDVHDTFNSFLKMNSHFNIPHPEPEIETHPEQFFPSNTNSQILSLLRKVLFGSKRSEERENKRWNFSKRWRNRSRKGRRHFHFDD